MKKNYLKILGGIITAVLICLILTTGVEATQEVKTIAEVKTSIQIAKDDKSTQIDGFDGIKDKADSFVNAGKDKGNDFVDPDSLHNVVKPIAQILVAIATVVISVVTLIMGMKYLMAAPDEKGKLKQSLIGLVVATLVIYGAQGIWALVYNFMTSVTS